MKWNKYRLKTTTQASDFVCSILIDLGITGMEVEDNIQLTEEEKKAQFIDYLADLPEDDGTAYVSFYTEEDSQDADNEKLLDTLREKLKEAKSFLDVGEGTIEKTMTEDVDWVNNWKKYFKSFTVDNFFIKPTWEELDESHKNMEMIEIDPGTAFGTGKHDTTQLCIKQLIKYVKPGDKVLDLGCGSGILSIVAKKLGAAEVTMTDIDPAAIEAVGENFAVNKMLMDDVEVLAGNVLEDTKMQKKFETEKYDIVVANILADVIIPIAGIVDRFLKPNGIFISSGIIYMKEDDVKEAVKNKVTFSEISKFPPVKRDLALLVDASVQFAEIEKVAYDTERKLLKDVYLFDVYEGKNLESGKKSYAVSFILQDETKTLNDKQIESIMNRIIGNLQQKLNAKLR